jgi:hypothetical protein
MCSGQRSPMNSVDTQAPDDFPRSSGFVRSAGRFGIRRTFHIHRQKNPRLTPDVTAEVYSPCVRGER